MNNKTKIHHRVTAWLLVCMAMLSIHAVASPIESTGKSNSTPSSEAGIDWWREAKFGMFIHWGIYAIPARGEWVMHTDKTPVAKYADIAKGFNPTKFNADEWVKVAKDAGMKYIIITSKHHDGFAMFDSKVSPFNIMAATPFKRDPLKELAEACKKAGIKLGFYYSQAQDWHQPGGAIAGKAWDPAQKGSFDQYQEQVVLPHLKELLSNYGAVGVIWFDTPYQMTPDKAKKITDLIHSIQPQTLINSRLLLPGRSSGTAQDGELAQLKEIGINYLSYEDRQIPDKPAWRDWETCMTLNNHWGYGEGDNHWKSPEMMVEQLIDIASKGGNYLLNVGPNAEGVIPLGSVERLAEVGKWMKINGEAIYGSQKSPFGYEYGPPAEENENKGKGKSKGAVATESLDWRCTSKPGKLYFFLLKWPGEKFSLKEFKSKASKAYLLADPDHKPLPLTQTGDELSVTLPANAPGQMVNVLCVEL